MRDFYCLNCFHSFRTENKLTKHKNVCENHDYCYVEMPKEDTKILKYNHREKSMKVPFIIYADLEHFLKKMNTCDNNPEKSSTTKINKHIPSGYSLFTHCSFDTSKIKLDYYRGKYIVSKRFFVYSKKDLVLMMTTKNTIKYKIIVIILENTDELLPAFVT